MSCLYAPAAVLFLLLCFGILKEKKERKSDSLCLCCTNKKSGGVHVEPGETLKTLFFLLFFFFSSVYERGRDAAKQTKQNKTKGKR